MTRVTEWFDVPGFDVGAYYQDGQWVYTPDPYVYSNGTQITLTPPALTNPVQANAHMFCDYFAGDPPPGFWANAKAVVPYGRIWPTGYEGFYWPGLTTGGWDVVGGGGLPVPSPPRELASWSFGSGGGFSAGPVNGTSIGRQSFNDETWLLWTYDTIHFDEWQATMTLALPTAAQLHAYWRWPLGDLEPPAVDDQNEAWGWLETNAGLWPDDVPFVPTSVDLTLNVVADPQRYSGTLRVYAAWVPKRHTTVDGYPDNYDRLTTHWNGEGAPDLTSFWTGEGNPSAFALVGSAGYSAAGGPLTVALDLSQVIDVYEEPHSYSEYFRLALVFRTEPVWIDPVQGVENGPYSDILTWDQTTVSAHYDNIKYRWVGLEIIDGGEGVTGVVNVGIWYDTAEQGYVIGTVLPGFPAQVVSKEPWPWLVPASDVPIPIPMASSTEGLVPFSTYIDTTLSYREYINGSQSPTISTDLAAMSDGSDLTTIKSIADPAVSRPNTVHPVYAQPILHAFFAPVPSPYPMIVTIRVRMRVTTQMASWTNTYVTLDIGPYTSVANTPVPLGVWTDVDFVYNWFDPIMRDQYFLGAFLDVKLRSVYCTSIEVSEWTATCKAGQHGVGPADITAVVRPDGRSGGTLNLLMNGDVLRDIPELLAMDPAGTTPWPPGKGQWDGTHLWSYSSGNPGFVPFSAADLVVLNTYTDDAYITSLAGEVTGWEQDLDGLVTSPKAHVKIGWNVPDASYTLSYRIRVSARVRLGPISHLYLDAGGGQFGFGGRQVPYVPGYERLFWQPYPWTPQQTDYWNRGDEPTGLAHDGILSALAPFGVWTTLTFDLASPWDKTYLRAQIGNPWITHFDLAWIKAELIA